jgi:hypothetical protein
MVVDYPKCSDARIAHHTLLACVENFNTWLGAPPYLSASPECADRPKGGSSRPASHSRSRFDVRNGPLALSVRLHQRNSESIARFDSDLACPNHIITWISCDIARLTGWESSHRVGIVRFPNAGGALCRVFTLGNAFTKKPF